MRFDHGFNDVGDGVVVKGVVREVALFGILAGPSRWIARLLDGELAGIGPFAIALGPSTVGVLGLE